MVVSTVVVVSTGQGENGLPTPGNSNCSTVRRYSNTSPDQRFSAWDSGRPVQRTKSYKAAGPECILHIRVVVPKID